MDRKTKKVAEPVAEVPEAPQEELQTEPTVAPALAIIESDPLAITPKDIRQRMAIEQDKRKAMTDYISANMKEGQDFGSIKIEGRDGQLHESKNTLFKPGSEKFCSLFGLRPIFRADTETLGMLGNRPGIVAFVCELVTKAGTVVGEGRGVADINEKRNWSLNNAVKIAEKRAQIDAVLRTGGLSDFFTQDLDDEAEPRTNQEGKREYVVSDKASAAQMKYLFVIMRANNVDKAKVEDWLLKTHNVIGVENMPKRVATDLIDSLIKKYGEPKRENQTQEPKEDLPSIDLDKEEPQDDGNL